MPVNAKGIVFDVVLERAGGVLQWLLHMHPPPRPDAPQKALLDWHAALARVCVRWQGGNKIAWAWDWWRGGEGTGRSRPGKHAVHATRLVRCTSRVWCECAQMVLTVARSLGTEEAAKLPLRAVACLLSYLQVPRLCPITLVHVR